MTLTTLSQALGQGTFPGLERLRVECSERCGHALGAEFKASHSISFDSDLRTILVSNNLTSEGVAELVDFAGACLCCGDPCHLNSDPFSYCCVAPNPVDVTARWLVWNKKPVDWEELLSPPWDECGYCGGQGLVEMKQGARHPTMELCPRCDGTSGEHCVQLIDAVILIGGSDPLHPDTVRTALQACDEAGVQFAACPRVMPYLLDGRDLSTVRL